MNYISDRVYYVSDRVHYVSDRVSMSLVKCIIYSAECIMYHIELILYVSGYVMLHSEYIMTVSHQFNPECSDAKVRQYLGIFQPYIHPVIATVLIMPVFLTLLLKKQTNKQTITDRTKNIVSMNLNGWFRIVQFKT